VLHRRLIMVLPDKVRVDNEAPFVLIPHRGRKQTQPLTPASRGAAISRSPKGGARYFCLTPDS
jgi:hypothetical protein